MPSGYDYGNARVRAMHSRLLSAVVLERMLSRQTVEECISVLAETEYQVDIEEALVLKSGIASVHTALSTNLTRSLRQLQSFYESDTLTLINLLMHRWDRHNMLAILRAQAQEANPESILSTLIPVGRLDAVSLRELVRQPGLRATLDLMRTWNLPYAAALREPGVSQELDRLEVTLNRVHYAALRAELDPDFADWPRSHPGSVERSKTERGGSPKRRDQNRSMVLKEIQLDIDRVNIGVVLRLARQPELIPVIERRYSNGGIHSLLIEPGGHVSISRLIGLLGERDSIENVVHGLGKTRYGAAIQAGWLHYQASNGNFSAFERELERYRIGRAAALANRNPLSIAVPLAYIACKQAEIDNLRLVIQAVSLDMLREKVRQELVFVGRHNIRGHRD